MVAPSFSVSDLVLDVPEKLDPKRFDLDAYMGFIELLCGGRVFQEAALAATLRFLLGGEFANVGDLAKHSYQKNQILEACYGSLDSLLASLRLREHGGSGCNSPKFGVRLESSSSRKQWQGADLPKRCPRL